MARRRSKARIRTVRNQMCVVTGAASGIGYSVASLLAGKGARLVLTDRDEAGLERAAQHCRLLGAEVVMAEPFDISDYEKVKNFGDRVVAEYGAPDVVFHVAGISAWGRPDVLEHRHWRDLIEVNLMGTVHIVEAFVPPMMAAAKPGALALVSSAAGLIGLPWHAAYSASKFGVRGIAEVLRFDLAAYDIGVHLVCPGGVDTPLVGTVEIAGVDRSDPKIADTVQQFRKHAVTPDQAAVKIIDGVLAGKYLVYTSPDVRLAVAAQNFCPPAYRAAMGLFNRHISNLAKGILP